ncbi:abscission/NoCut checkpoint regulator [Anthonomus grandis grandis]|uniref:abscission/NoCut checkpoint regulator n=1 Tax=Anthonomus grandis grandis TaxID=2921223 RepID=UPI00216506D7|nr:abscission/NoCut checkpoint regulator [Anthonomus grandis grandis]
MSCNHCYSKFGFFNKELGCTNCGLSLCSKCLQQKSKIPNKGHEEHKVCRTCFLTISNASKNSYETCIVPPDRFLKRLENLENPAARPITVYKHNQKMDALRTGLSEQDRELVDRLEKLKEKQPPAPADSEIRERLAKLKGETFASGSDSNKPFFIPPDTRSEQEKVDSLLEQFSSQQGIDAAYKPHDDLAQRLATLKGEEHKENKIDYMEESDSEDEVDRITQKIVSQVSIDERCPIDPSKTLPNDDDEEEFKRTSPELPWCVLCNNDAKFKCYDCGGDLYCGSCNTEVHKNWGDTDHRVVAYKPE